MVLNYDVICAKLIEKLFKKYNESYSMTHNNSMFRIIVF